MALLIAEGLAAMVHSVRANGIDPSVTLRSEGLSWSGFGVRQSPGLERLEKGNQGRPIQSRQVADIGLGKGGLPTVPENRLHQ